MGKASHRPGRPGWKIGDSILKINGEDVDNAPGAARLLEKKRRKAGRAVNQPSRQK